VRYIYLDTNLWNELYDQRVDPDSLVSFLAERTARIVLSDETAYELAKTFTGKGPESLQRAIGLFSYLKSFISHSIPITKDNMAMVAAEMQAIQYRMREIYPFINAGDYETVRAVIEEHAAGQMSERSRKHIEGRIASNESGRKGIAYHIENTPQLKLALQRVTEEQLPAWLRSVRTTTDGVQYLAWQIKQYFDDKPFDDIYVYAQELRRSNTNRVAMSLSTRNFYFNWRYVHNKSIRADLFSDTNHIINANYCDIYATKEPKQAKYAGYLLTPATRICIYDPNQTSILQWLLSL
jgi:hypothetical protein